MRIALIGYGRMGQAVEAAATARGWVITHRITLSTSADLATVGPDTTDVAIDFTSPSAVLHTLEALVPLGLPVVVGTTGWLDQLPRARQLVELNRGGLIVGANFSIGVNLLLRLNQVLARWMNAHPEFDAFIEDRHHRGKADAPSGTALRLAQDLLREHPAKSSIVTADDLRLRAPLPHELSVGAVRAGALAGTHTVAWNSPVETLELRHTAHSREGFAQGACFAAQWLMGRPGFYQFEDLFETH